MGIYSTNDMLSGMTLASRELPYVDFSKNALGTIRSYTAQTYDTYDDFPLPQQVGALVIALDENAVYRYNETDEYFFVDNIVAYKRDSIFELPTLSYYVLKDTSEILGFNLSIPILPYKTEFNRFVIGDMLAKDNGLIRMRASNKTFYLRSTNALFSKANTQKFNDTTDQYAFPSTLITNNYIDVSTIAFLYDNYCIVDRDNLYIAVNQRNLDGNKINSIKGLFQFCR